MKRVYRIISTIVVMMLLFSCFAFAQDVADGNHVSEQIMTLTITSDDYINDVEGEFNDIQRNAPESPENTIKDLVALLFKLKISEIAQPDKQFQDFSIFWDKNSHNMNNLEYFSEDIKSKN